MISKDLLIVLIIGASIRIFGMLILDLGEWDERFHANVAKNFLENPIEPYLIKDSIVNLENSDWSQTDVWMQNLHLHYGLLHWEFTYLGQMS